MRATTHPITRQRTSIAPRLAAVCAIVAVLQPAGTAVAAGTGQPARESAGSPLRIPSLEELSIEALRARRYSSELTIVARLATLAGESTLPAVSAGAFIGEYRSDGLRVYTRIDVPSSPAPAQGYPVVVFLHGWSSNDTAAEFNFAQQPESVYRRVIETFVAAGFVVVYPGWRGYGTFNDRRADGAEYLTAWNNASYLAPIYFAVDTLNLLDGLHTLGQVDWREWGFPSARAVSIDPRSVHIAGHSQGGDVVLVVLAVAGEGSGVRSSIASGSIWAGCFPSRFTQLETYGPMQATLEAFFSGDGTWTGTAMGRNGVVNRNFVFGWPPDWIETVDRASPAWTWQAETWSVPTVVEVLRQKYGEMYSVLNRNVADLGDARVEVTVDASGRAVVRHDPRVAAAMERIGGFGYPQYLTEPLALHFSDQDFYSTPGWNENLSRRINAAGGRSIPYVYPGNTHGLEKSGRSWFSGPGVVPGFASMLERDVALFRGQATMAADSGGLK